MHRRTVSMLSRWALAAALTAALATTPAAAILYAPIEDLDLARGADLVVDAVIAQELPPREDVWSTEYRVVVTRVLVGVDRPSTLVVASPGRLLADGSGLHVPGAPRFEPGDRAILFLGAPDREGLRPIHQLVLGVFHRVETAAGTLAVRDLAGATELGPDGELRAPGASGAGASEPVREFDRFAAWLEEVGAGIAREADYVTDAPAPERIASGARVSDAYSFFVDPPARWFQFDSGSSVPLRSNAAGQVGVDGDVEHVWVQTASTTWTADPGSNIRLAYTGTTPAGGGLRRRDSTNTVLWNDPNGEVSGSFTCGGGGVLGLGGGWYSGSHTFRNGDGAIATARALLEADVVINDGAGCYLIRHQGRDGEEVVAHEVGHAIGLGHSSVNSALMRGTAHGDGRGASLRDDDRAAIRYLYPDPSAGSGGGGGGGGDGEPGTVRFRDAAVAGAEGGSATLVVQRSGGVAGAASVQYSLVSGTAAVGQDCVAASGTLSWADGDGSNRRVVVQLLQDQAVEGTETFEARLSGAQGATLGTPARVTVSVEDDDHLAAPESVLSFQHTSFSVAEGARVLDVPVSREGSLAGAAAVNVVAVGGSAAAGVDFEGLPVRLSWGDGEGGVRTARLTLIDDRLVEGDETIALALRKPSAGASVGGGSAAVTLLDDDQAASGGGSVRFAGEIFSALEGDGVLAVAVERFGGARGAVSVRVSSVEASALDGIDFGGAVDTVSWRDGESGTKTVRFAVYPDVRVEGAESFGVALDQPTGDLALAQPRVATAIVRDDDFRVEQEVRLPDARAHSPRVAYHRDGRSAVAWSAPDGAGAGVFAQLYDATGREDGSPFRLHSAAAGDQRLPAIAFDTSGRLITAWIEEGGDASTTPAGRVVAAASVGTRLRARVWSGPGTAASAPMVLAESGRDPGPIALASDGQGRHWVAWEDQGMVRVRRFDEQGALGPAIEAGAGDLPALGVAVTGEAAAVWRAGGAIRLRRFDPVGATLATVTVAEAAGVDHPDVAVRADGGVVVVWSQVGSTEDVFHRRYDRAGRALGPAQRSHSVFGGTQRRPRVASNAIGDFAVAWEDDALGQVWARVFDAAGAPQGDQVVIGPGGGAHLARSPVVAIGEHDEVTVGYELRSYLGERAGVALRKVRAQVLDQGCAGGGNALCTHRSRFAVTALWRDASGQEGVAQGSALGTDTGYFWFFDAANVELVVKALDGCGVNDRFWVFAGGLTDLEVLLLVDDLESGHSRAYFNPLGRAFAPIRDAGAFSSCDVALGVHGAQTPQSDALEARWDRPPSEPVRLADPAGVCRADQDTLCLGQDGRFQVEVEWSTASGAGAGFPVAVTPDTGSFWFFGPDNVELVVKVLDACALNDEYWVFAGGLTDVGVELLVVDKESGRRRRYVNPVGQAFQPVRDVLAFPCR